MIIKFLCNMAAGLEAINFIPTTEFIWTQQAMQIVII